MSDRRAPKRVAAFTHEMEAGLLINWLQEQGIHAQAVGESVAGLRAEAPGEVVVVVPADQFEEAMRITRQLQETDHKIDWSAVDFGDPIE